MPVDRAFIIRGFGTVITGTALSGRVAVGNEVEILPEEITAKVRGIQIHGKTIQEGFAGSRVAINLQGIEKEKIKRGDTIVTPGTIKPTKTVEVLISLLPSASRPLKDGMDVLLHFATTAVTSSPILLGAKEIKPGEVGFARIKVKEPVTVMHGDRFVLRMSDAGTIGGGIFLDMDPPRRGRSAAVEELKILGSDDVKAKVLLHINRRGTAGIVMNALLLRLNTPGDIVKKVVSELTALREIYKIDDTLLSAGTVKKIKNSIISELGTYHKTEPLKEGMLKEEVRTKLKLSQKLLGLAIDELVKERLIAAGRDTIRLSSHKTPEGGRKEDILKVYTDAGLTPPTLSELLEKVKIREREAMDLLYLLTKEGKLLKVKDLFFSGKSVDDLIDQVRRFFSNKNEMTPADFKDMTSLSRKFAIPLLEYLDSQKITIRVGDARRLRKG